MRKSKRKASDIEVGYRCNRWTVTGPPTKDADGSHLFPVRCDCGTEKSLRFRYLKEGSLSSKSCGCLQRETAAKTSTKHGQYASSKTSRQRRLYCEYGLTQEKYDEMYDSQGGRCAICLDSFGENTLHVDHDHNTGVVRGLLCRLCNTGIGHFRENKESMKRAIKYLEGND